MWVNQKATNLLLMYLRNPLIIFTFCYLFLSFCFPAVY